MFKEKWIALAEVMPTVECRELQQPAFVNVIGLASDEESFIEMIRTECSMIKLQLVTVEDVELWRERIADWQPDDEVLDQAASVCEQRPFMFGTFICFNDEIN
jgi:hypothetical protein